MAGLLDSDLVQFLAAPRAYYQRKNQLKDAEAFKGLLGTLEQPGPVQPGGLLESRAPDQQFWLQAAQIPSYQDVASQQLGYGAAGQQAMARQMQQQQYEGSNLSLAQQKQLELQQRSAEFNEDIGLQDLRRKWYGTQASAAASGASAQNSHMGALLSQARLQKQLQDNQTAQGPLYNQLPPMDRMKVNQNLLRYDAAVDSTQEVLDWVFNRDPSAPLRAIGTARGGAMAADWMLAALPVMKDMVGAGALDEGERKWFLDLVGSPDALHLTANEENKMKLIGQKVIDFRNQTYKSVGLPGPTQRGPGAVSRSQGAQPKGALTPYTP